MLTYAAAKVHVNKDHSTIISSVFFFFFLLGSGVNHLLLPQPKKKYPKSETIQRQTDNRLLLD